MECFGFAYSDCSRSTSGSQNRAVLSKGHDNSVFFHSQQNKDNAKVQVVLASTLYTQQLRNYFQNIETMQSRSMKNDENQ